MTDSDHRRSPDAGTPADLGATALSAGTPPSNVDAGAAGTAGPIGRVLKGRYKIKRLLGEGGMGGVYEGEHLEIGKRVAIKIVHTLHARDKHIAARIKQEARSTSAIESEHIVQVFDAGEDEELGLFLVMELLKGEDLGNLLERRKRLTPASTAALIVQAAQGLARAHAAGIVHRDLKPANVFVCARDDGSSLVKLVDFGIAKIVRDAQSGGPGGGLTRLGMVIGTPQYMSPEQAQGLPTVDARTDVYSLGAVLFECIVGTSPFPEMPTYEQTILQIMTRPAPRLRDVVPNIQPALDALCADMMAMDPAARPQDMATVRERLIRIFPEIESSRAPMRSITAEMGLEVTAFDAGMTGEKVQALVDEARRATASGPAAVVAGAGVRRPGTHSAVALDSMPDAEEAAPQVAGLPRGGMRTTWVLAASAVALVGVVAAVGLTRGQRHEDAPRASAGVGLVQSATEAIAPVSSPPAPAAQLSAATTATPPPTVAPARTATSSSAASAAHLASGGAPHAKGTVKGAAPASVAAGAASSAPGTAPVVAPSPPRAAEEPPAARPVGGTGVANEF